MLLAAGMDFEACVLRERRCDFFKEGKREVEKRGAGRFCLLFSGECNFLGGSRGWLFIVGEFGRSSGVAVKAV